MIDPENVKLGKLAKKFDPNVRSIAPISHTWPPPPDSVDWSAKDRPDFGMMLNDRLGNCTCAGGGHAIQVWTSQTRPEEVTVADADVLAMYEGACGYKPDNPETDQGGIETEVLRYWQKNPLAGHKLDAVGGVAPGSRTDVKAAVWLFGGCYIGVQLPTSAQSQAVWDVPAQGPRGSGAPGSWGGHCVFVVGYNDIGLSFVSWGKVMKMTWAFWDTYVDEAYALLSPDWFAANDEAPMNFKYQELVDYLNQFRRL